MWSDQMVSLSKSGLIFSTNCHNRLRRKLSQVAGIREVDNGIKYLGNPLILSHKKSLDFNHIKVRVMARIEG